jgi:hypothetical protein
VSDVEFNVSTLDQVSSQSVELFLEYPSVAYVTQEEGLVVTAAPLPEDAAEETVKSLPPNKQATLILEILQTAPEQMIFAESVFLSSEEVTFAQAVVTILRDVVVRQMYKDQRVQDRADANSERESELNSEIHSKVRPIR